MCWITMQKWRTRPRIAKRKIETWKFYIKKSYVNQDELLISPWQKDKVFQNMRHNILVADGLHGKHLNIECFNCFNSNEWNIQSGFHSLQKEKFHRKMLPLSKELVIEGGNYVFHTQAVTGEFNRNVIVQCFIPTGAEYYLNESGEYVSNKIIIGDEIPLDKIPLSNLPLLKHIEPNFINNLFSS